MQNIETNNYQVISLPQGVEQQMETRKVRELYRQICLENTAACHNLGTVTGTLHVLHALQLPSWWKKIQYAIVWTDGSPSHQLAVWPGVELSLNKKGNLPLVIHMLLGWDAGAAGCVGAAEKMSANGFPSCSRSSEALVPPCTQIVIQNLVLSFLTRYYSCKKLYSSENFKYFLKRVNKFTIINDFFKLVQLL